MGIRHVSVNSHSILLRYSEGKGRLIASPGMLWSRSIGKLMEEILTAKVPFQSKDSIASIGIAIFDRQFESHPYPFDAPGYRDLINSSHHHICSSFIEGSAFQPSVDLFANEDQSRKERMEWEVESEWCHLSVFVF
jgi:hypothetical protein